MNSRQSSEPPRRLLGLICRLPAGLVSPNSGNSSTEAQKKKNYKKPNQNKNLGSQFNPVAQESAAETRTCLLRLFGGSPVQIFKAVGVSQFAQAMSERTHTHDIGGLVVELSQAKEMKALQCD